MVQLKLMKYQLLLVFLTLLKKKTLSYEDEDDFVAEKKVLIQLKKFLPAVIPLSAFTNKALPTGIVPGRVPVPALASILAPNPSITDFGYYGLQEWRLLALLIMTR
jgi:hypothetical protein